TLKNAWTTSRQVNFFWVANFNLKFGSKIENEVFLIFWKKQLTKQTKSCIIKQIFKAGGSGNEKV
ncbi:hypothetical protein OLH08_06055, partial [Streptococcus pneumoniae]|nr:hypothetical protein [Streptococcus pneumoniae]MDG9615495.1 hypothetical protein [Streptococcus pneumoniae]